MFKVGDLVVDEVRQKLGVVMAANPGFIRGPVLSLRPPKGGREWDILARHCRAPKPHEVTSAEALTHVESQS